MNEHILVVSEGAVTLLRIFLGCVAEKAGRDCLLHTNRVLTTGNYIQFVPIHDSQHLLPDVLRAPQCPCLEEVLKAPGIGELIVLPRVVDGEECDVVTFRLMELCLALVSLCLLVLNNKEWRH